MTRPHTMHQLPDEATDSAALEARLIDAISQDRFPMAVAW